MQWKSRKGCTSERLDVSRPPGNIFIVFRTYFYANTPLKSITNNLSFFEGIITKNLNPLKRCLAALNVKRYGFEYIWSCVLNSSFYFREPKQMARQRNSKRRPRQHSWLPFAVQSISLDCFLTTSKKESRRFTTEFASSRLTSTISKNAMNVKNMT